jgi:tetratricopeptide (TPR) repeat protein/transcriptional regulator with XRE-family HTH domain
MLVLEQYVNPLRVWMDATGFTYEELAQETGLSVRTLKGYGAGERPIPRRSCELLAPVLGCSVEYLALSGVHQSNMLQLAGTYHLWSLAGVETMSELRGEIIHRREFLRRIAVGGVTLYLRPLEVLSPDTLDRITHAVAHPSCTDLQTVASLEAITHHFWDLYRSAIVKIDLLSSVIGHLQTLNRLLRGAGTQEVERRLATLVSHTAQIAGEISFDVQDIPRAEDYYTLAIEAADLAGDRALQSIALGRLGFLPIYCRQFKEALEPLEEALHLSANSAIPTARSWIAMMKAEALANLSDADRCSRTIGEAEDIFIHATPGEDTLGTGFTRSTLTSFKGICYLRLRQPDDAQEALQASLQEFTQPTRRRAIILTDLAHSYVLQKEIEQACRIASEAGSLADQTKSSRAVHRLRKLQRELKPWRATAEVQQLHEQLLHLKAG